MGRSGTRRLGTQGARISDGRTPATSTVEQPEHRGPKRQSNMIWQTRAKRAGLGQVRCRAGIENNGAPETLTPTSRNKERNSASRYRTVIAQDSRAACVLLLRQALDRVVAVL